MSTNRPPERRTRSSRHAADKIHAYEQMMQYQHLTGGSISNRTVMPSSKTMAPVQKSNSSNALSRFGHGIVDWMWYSLMKLRRR